MKAFLVILNVCLLISAFFTATVPTSSEFNQLSSLFILLFAIPSAYGLYKSVGNAKALVIFSILGIFAITFEYFSIKTGFPYGAFEYTSNVGLKILDTVPWAIAFAWVPMVLASYIVAHSFNIKNKYILLLLSALILVWADFVLDPGAVALNMWIWQDKSFLYSVPLSNYFGWFISGLLGSIIITLISKKTSILNSKWESWLLSSFYIIVGFWTYINLFKGQWIAFIAGIVLLGVLSVRTLKNQQKRGN